MFDTDVVLPPQAVLLHIGPHKTGTTAVQTAFHTARRPLRAEGIRYAGRQEQPMRAAIAVTSGRSSKGAPDPDLGRWERLVRQVQNASDQRVVVSSEFFCEGDDAAARRVVEGLGGKRVHVIVTLRPLPGILPSQWQQYVQNGLRLTYDDWLVSVLDRPRFSPPSPMFWRRHDHADLVDRWAGIVGPENLVAVMPDLSDHRSLLRGFETILRLDDGFLVARESITNRSLTVAEVEVVRLLNVEFERRNWRESEHYHALMRLGVIRQLLRSQTSGIDGERMSTPRWALERASDIGAESANRIEASGVRVIGDLSMLAAMPSDPADVRENDAPMPASPPSATTAVVAVVGAIIGSGVTGDTTARKVRLQTVREARSADLIKVIARRGRKRLRRPTSQ